MPQMSLQHVAVSVAADEAALLEGKKAAARPQAIHSAGAQSRRGFLKAADRPKMITKLMSKIHVPLGETRAACQ